MSNTKHTPGPWRITTSSNNGKGSDWRDIIGNDGRGDIYVAEAQKSDARLIASAPDLLMSALILLERLERSEDIPRDCVAGVMMLTNAVKKATGGEE